MVKFLFEIEQEIWDKFKMKVPRNETLEHKIIELIKEYSR
jgi:hypothetical protein